MRVFLDFEASSLSKASYPIEIGWVFEDGTAEGHLIQPAPAWTEWDERVAAIHRISREQLLAEGKPHDEVCRRMVEVLTGHTLYASAPSWDGRWLSVLLRAAGFPRHLLRLRDSDEAFVEAATARLGEGATETMIALISTLIAIAGWWMARSIYLERNLAADEVFEQRAPVLARTLENKWYVDELYGRVIVRPLEATSLFLWRVVDAIIDGIATMLGFMVRGFGDLLRFFQTGNVRNYALMFFIGVVVFVWVLA